MGGGAERGRKLAEEDAVLAGSRAGKSLRAIAVDLWGTDRVAADWHPDGWMRAKVRRLVRQARAAARTGSGDDAAGTP